MGKVLLIEDNESNIHLMEFLLKNKGFSVKVARNGREAIDSTIRRKI
ncbi:MAG: hypothetical protein ACUVUG_07190 [Candidatus Aminicenantia bacterium]